MIIEKFLKASFQNMSNVIRYSWNRVNHKENLAEHTYYVSILADLFTQDIKERFPKRKIDELKVLKFALYHDYEEVFTGDLITPVKYKSELLRNELEKVWKEMMIDWLETDYGMYYNHIKKNILKNFNEYEKFKYINLENKIVKFSDQFETVLYSIWELNSWNLYFETVLNTIINWMIEQWWKSNYFWIYIKELITIVNNKWLTKQKFEEIDID